MCGFTGLVDLNSTHKLSEINKANDFLVHRGPDKFGYSCINLQNNELQTFTGCDSDESNIDFSKHSGNILLGFRRLSIVDLSHKADQPMVAKNKDKILVFNGEIFNHRELKHTIKKNINFKTSHSDTELLLNGLDLYGYKFVEKCNGQFSFVFIDLKNQTLLMGRDRLGQKPLYFYKDIDKIIFGSSLDSVCETANKRFNLDSKSLKEYFSFGAIPSPNTMISEIKKLKPAQILEFSLNDLSLIRNETYWETENFVDEKKFSFNEFIDLFEDSTRKRLDVDVNKGFLLSGGLDSTSVVSAASNFEDSLNTFCIGFDNDKIDETYWANKASKVYSTNHITSKLSSSMDKNLVKESFHAYDEPFSDPTSVPTYLVTNEISKFLTVALSGDGGDELLAGYIRYKKAHKKNQNIFLDTVKSFISNSLFSVYPKYLGTGQTFKLLHSNHKKRYASFFQDTKFLKILDLDIDFLNFEERFMDNHFDQVKSMQIADYKFYLPEVMMVKVDRASMYNSVELRSPFLDHRLIEYVLSVSSDSYFSNESMKIPLKKYLSDNFDETFLNRKKQGFSVPLNEWLINDLKKESGLFDTYVNHENSYVYNNLSHNFQNLIKNVGKYPSSVNRLWKLIAFEMWFLRFKKYLY